jgi:hypothetical protein
MLSLKTSRKVSPVEISVTGIPQLFYGSPVTRYMTTEYEPLALKFAPELYYVPTRNPFENISPEDRGGVYWRAVTGSRRKEVCIQYIVYFTHQRWVPSIFDKFTGKLPGEHPNDYVPIYLYFKNETPVRAVFDICHYEAVGDIDDSHLLPRDRTPKFLIRNFYRGVLPLKDTRGCTLLKGAPQPLSSERLAGWWEGMTSTGSYSDKAKLIIRNKIKNPFQEMKTFRDRAGKLGFLFDLIFRSIENQQVKGPVDDSALVSQAETQLGQYFTRKDIEEIMEKSGVPEYLSLRWGTKFQRI